MFRSVGLAWQARQSNLIWNCNPSHASHAPEAATCTVMGPEADLISQGLDAALLLVVVALP